MNIKDKNGFSLMELMIVIAIIGILSGISLFTFFSPEHRVKKIAREMMGDMQKARMAAVKNNQDWALVFDTANSRYLICSDSGADGVWSNTADNTIEKTVNFTTHASGVSYGHDDATINATVAGGTNFPDDDISYTSNVLTFNTNGTCNAGYVYIDYRDVTYAIGTLSTGIVRIKRWYNGGWQ